MFALAGSVIQLSSDDYNRNEKELYHPVIHENDNIMSPKVEKER